MSVSKPNRPPNWPTIEQYFAAVMKPATAFPDENLKKALLCPTFGKTQVGIDMDATAADDFTVDKTVIKGRHNIVFKLASVDGAKQYAVKCFLHNVSDRQVRYDAIHKSKKLASQGYFIPFIFQSQGIIVGGGRYPIVKMKWANAERIDDYVTRQLQIGQDDAIKELIPKFRKMMEAFSSDGIAHGDLEPGNILITEDGQLKIVDYDNVYVPALAGSRSSETGHPDFQHPMRDLNVYAPYVDNYSAIVIDSILQCLACAPPQALWSWSAMLQQFQKGSLEPSRAPKDMKNTSWFSVSPDQETGESLSSVIPRVSRELKEYSKGRIGSVPALKSSRSTQQ